METIAFYVLAVLAVASAVVVIVHRNPVMSALALAVNLVTIITPHNTHAALAMKCLRAGKHVVVEKPLALTLAECDRLIEASARSTSKVVVGFNLRWHRLVRRAREFLSSGALGRIKAVRSAYTHDRLGEAAPDWHRKLELGGGVSFNEAVHHFDLWTFLLDCRVARIHAVNRPSSGFDDDTCTVTAEMATAIGDVFTEVVVAPDFEPEALEILAVKKNLRVMSANAASAGNV